VGQGFHHVGVKWLVRTRAFKKCLRSVWIGLRANPHWALWVFFNRPCLLVFAIDGVRIFYGGVVNACIRPPFCYVISLLFIEIDDVSFRDIAHLRLNNVAPKNIGISLGYSCRLHHVVIFLIGSLPLNYVNGCTQALVRYSLVVSYMYHKIVLGSHFTLLNYLIVSRVFWLPVLVLLGPAVLGAWSGVPLVTANDDAWLCWAPIHFVCYMLLPTLAFGWNYPWHMG
jgi:hypothetical protein